MPFAPHTFTQRAQPFELARVCGGRGFVEAVPA